MVFWVWLCKVKFPSLPSSLPSFFLSFLLPACRPLALSVALCPTPRAGDEVRRGWCILPAYCSHLYLFPLTLPLQNALMESGKETRGPVPCHTSLVSITWPHADRSSLTWAGQTRAIPGEFLGEVMGQDTWGGRMHSDNLEVTWSYSVIQNVYLSVFLGLTVPDRHPCSFYYFRKPLKTNEAESQCNELKDLVSKAHHLGRT